MYNKTKKERGKGKMTKNMTIESLEAVHTHTHTHTHRCSQKKFNKK